MKEAELGIDIKNGYKIKSGDIIQIIYENIGVVGPKYKVLAVKNNNEFQRIKLREVKKVLKNRADNL